MADYHLADSVHTDWDRGRDPALAVEPGATIEFDCLDANGGRIPRDATAADLADTPFVGHHLTGPVAVEGAEPGDTLRVDVLAVEHEGWGYNLVRPGEGGDGPGLLPEEFPEPAIHTWELDDGVGHFVDGIEVPLDPFPGVLGVAPAEPGPHGTGPPRAVGGNLDVKHLTAGATLYLPVAVEGALFSIGDGHAAQGDGEVCVSAIEAPISATVRLSLADREVSAPEFRTTGPFAPGDGGPAYATAGVEDSLMGAAKAALRSMLDRIHREHGLSRTEAYLLCSVVADLKINQVVNA
ncbi:MAG: acetamidase/formamidase family protein, partial [Halobacteriaceae archaeon]